jgi:valyl-tRNA synthetase
MQNELLQDSSFGQISVHKKTDFDQLDDILNHFLRNISVVEGEGGIFVNDSFSISIETDSSKKEQFRAMINGKIAETERYIARIKGKLSNANFVEKADPEVVEQERIKLSVSEKRLSTLSALRN